MLIRSDTPNKGLLISRSNSIIKTQFRLVQLASRSPQDLYSFFHHHVDFVQIKWFRSPPIPLFDKDVFLYCLLSFSPCVEFEFVLVAPENVFCFTISFTWCPHCDHVVNVLLLYGVSSQMTTFSPELMDLRILSVICRLRGSLS